MAGLDLGHVVLCSPSDRFRVFSNGCEITYVVRVPVADQVGGHRAEDLGEDLPVLARGGVPQVDRLLGERVRDRPVLVGVELVVVRMRRRAHERGDLGLPVLAELRADKPEMLCAI